MVQVPRGLITHPEIPLNLGRGDFALCVDHQGNGEKPFRQWKVCVMEQRTGGDRELMALVCALVQVPGWNGNGVDPPVRPLHPPGLFRRKELEHSGRTAVHTTDIPRPTKALGQVNAGLLRF
jgi:hypothetical protein